MAIHRWNEGLWSWQFIGGMVDVGGMTVDTDCSVGYLVGLLTRDCLGWSFVPSLLLIVDFGVWVDRRSGRWSWSWVKV